MRLNDPPRSAISSEPEAGSSGVAKLPRLIWSAILARRTTGRTTVKYTSSASKQDQRRQKNQAERHHEITKIPANSAIWMGTVIGTDTICAPTVSPIFHPKPLAVP